MSKYRDGYLTDKGLDFARLALNNNIKIHFTKGVLSSENHAQDTQQTIQSLTSLQGFCDSDPINYVPTIDSENVSVPLTFLNTTMTSDNYVNTVGIYATDGTNEILYSIIINDDPELFPAYNGTTPEKIKINSTTQVGRASNVTAQLSPMGMVTEEEFQSIKDDKDHNFTAKLQHNGVDVADVNELSSVASNFATQSYANSVAAQQYNNAVNTANAFTLKNSIGKPMGNLASGDDLKNHLGKLEFLNINGLNPVSDLQSTVGLPAKTIWGGYIGIPNGNYTDQYVFDNLGNIWVQQQFSTIGSIWKNIISGTSLIYSGTYNLDDFYLSGTYVFGTNVVLNDSTGLNSGSRTLIVTQTDMGDIYQELRTNNDVMGYRRIFSFNGWNSWQKVGNIEIPLRITITGPNGSYSNLRNNISAFYNATKNTIYVQGYVDDYSSTININISLAEIHNIFGSNAVTIQTSNVSSVVSSLNVTGLGTTVYTDQITITGQTYYSTLDGSYITVYPLSKSSN